MILDCPASPSGDSLQRLLLTKLTQHSVLESIPSRKNRTSPTGRKAITCNLAEIMSQAFVPASVQKPSGMQKDASRLTNGGELLLRLSDFDVSIASVFFSKILHSLHKRDVGVFQEFLT